MDLQNELALAAASLPEALIHIRIVTALTGISPATVYRKVAAETFPAPIRLGTRCTRWRAAEVRAWIQAPR